VVSLVVLPSLLVAVAPTPKTVPAAELDRDGDEVLVTA
jgi:hypothetical protein